MMHSLVTHARLAAALALAATLSALLAGCGVDFGSGDEGTELFARLTVEGSPRVGSPLTLNLEYTQVYDVDIDVRCVLEDKNEARLAVIGEGRIPANPEANPKVTPTPALLSFHYQPDRVGAFRIVCETPADDTNAIGRDVNIAP